MAMMDQLAFYRLDTATLARIQGMDLLIDSELAEQIERRGTFLSDLFIDGLSLGTLLSGLGPILGAPVDGLMGRSDMRLEPSGPVTWTSHVTRDLQPLILKALARAQRLLRDPTEEPAVAARLQSHAEQFGGASKVAAALQKIQKQLEAAASPNGELIVVFTRWR